MIACAPSKRVSSLAPDPGARTYVASCVTAQARQEGFRVERTPGPIAWVLTRAYQQSQDDVREELVYLRPDGPHLSDTVRVETAAGTSASPRLNRVYFAPAMDRVLRRINANCVTGEPTSPA
jgi:hypothetical protein